MKYFQSKRKKWEELTTEEKVNYLRYQDRTSYNIFGAVFIIALGVGLLMMINQASLIQKVDNLENQTGIYMPKEDLAKITEAKEQGIFIFNIFLLLALIDVIVGGTYLIYEMHKWEPFKKSLRKKQEVRY